MSSNRDRDLKNLHDLMDHLSRIDFNGSLNVSFREGAPTSVSKKDELTPDLLDRFLHRPVVVRRAKKEIQTEPETSPSTSESGKIDDTKIVEMS